MTPRLSPDANSIFGARQDGELYDLHIDLLKLRTEDSRFRQQGSGGIDGAVLGPASFVLRYFSEDNNDRLLIVNFAERRVLHPASEPLLAPPAGIDGKRFGRSDSPRYGGADAIVTATPEQWMLPGESRRRITSHTATR